jgi:hypothetical protein
MFILLTSEEAMRIYDSAKKISVEHDSEEYPWRTTAYLIVKGLPMILETMANWNCWELWHTQNTQHIILGEYRESKGLPRYAN